MIVNDLIYAAYRIAGMLTKAGRGVSDSETWDGFYALNTLLDQWTSERLMVSAILRTLFPITAGKQSYTVGLPSTTGTWDTTTNTWDQQTQTWDQTGYNPDWTLVRPIRIERAGYVYMASTPPVEQPMVIMADQEWESLSPKGLLSAIPTQLYYQPLVPLGVVNLWPIPDGSDNIQIAIYSWQVVQEFATPQDTVYLPPAYKRAIEYGLAVELAMRNPTRSKMNPASIQIAVDAKKQVKNLNSPVWLSQCESGALGGATGNGGHWNILSNTFLPGGFPT